MAAIALTTADRVRNASKNFSITDVLIASEAIEAGAPVRLVTTTGKAANGNATSAAEARIVGVALMSVAAGEAVEVLMYGEMDGFVLTDQDYDEAIYLSDTDATLADAAGTVEVIIGRVVPALATTLGTAADKLLRVNCLGIEGQTLPAGA